MTWMSKWQGTVKGSTYGAEFVALCMAVEYMVGLCYRFRMLGVKVEGPSYMFTDNMLIIKSSAMPSAELKKKHFSICYHYVQEAIAAGIIWIFHIKLEDNPVNPLTKSTVLTNMKIIKELFFYQGD